MSADIPIIRLTINIPMTNTAIPNAREFLQRLNVIIAGQSTLNYHMIPLSNKPMIYIPVFPYKRSDFTNDMEKLVRDRINTLKEFLSTYEFDKERSNILWYFRGILIMRQREFSGEKLPPLFKIENKDYNVVEYADIRKDTNVKYPTMKRYRLTDGSYISIWHDPYAIDNHVILCNLSKPFSEMRYQYNALHLYEHLMTYAWKNVDHEKEAYINGLTVVNGISNVFAVLNTKEAMMEYLDKYIDFILKSRDKSFWIKNKEMLRTETIRTISETRAARSFSSPSRSDPAAYDCNYNIDIFCKWSNEPFDILLISNTETKINVNAINAKILSAKTTKITLNTPLTAHIPVEALMDKSVIHIKRESAENILKEIRKHGFGNIPGKLYGIDNYMLFPDVYDIHYDYHLHALIYMHRFIKNIDEYDEKLSRNLILPWDYKDVI